MPIQSEDKKYYDFEEIFFEKDCNIDSIINNFFIKYPSMLGNIHTLKLPFHLIKPNKMGI